MDGKEEEEEDKINNYRRSEGGEQMNQKKEVKSWRGR